jgi:hypothetical protein
MCADEKLFIACVNHLETHVYFGKWSMIRVKTNVDQPESFIKVDETEDEICDILTRFLLIEDPRRKMRVFSNE